jgi:hypothetical protein
LPLAASSFVAQSFICVCASVTSLKIFLALPAFPTKKWMTNLVKMTYLQGFAKTLAGAAYGGNHPGEDFGA